MATLLVASSLRMLSEPSLSRHSVLALDALMGESLSGMARVWLCEAVSVEVGCNAFVLRISRTVDPVDSEWASSSGTAEAL